MTIGFEIVVGTYEQFVVGYKVTEANDKYNVKSSFASHAHLSSVRSVASRRHYLASAGADDCISLFDMRSRIQSGRLVHHDNTINSIEFTPDGSHLISTSSDGSIAIVRCGNWQLEKLFNKPHKGEAVDLLAIHPSGKICLTTGRDGVLRTWNLVKGRQAYATNLVTRWKMDAKYMSVLKWSPSGDTYLIGGNNKLEVYTVETAGIKQDFVFESKVVCVEYLDEEFVAVGLEDGKISILNIETGSLVNELKAHELRVKCMARHENILVSASSSGEIKLWAFEKDDLKYLSAAKCDGRITCITIIPQSKSDKLKEEENVKTTKKTSVTFSNKDEDTEEEEMNEEEEQAEDTEEEEMDEQEEQVENTEEEEMDEQEEQVEEEEKEEKIEVKKIKINKKVKKVKKINQVEKVQENQKGEKKIKKVQSVQSDEKYEKLANRLAQMNEELEKVVKIVVEKKKKRLGKDMDKPLVQKKAKNQKHESKQEIPINRRSKKAIKAGRNRT